VSAVHDERKLRFVFDKDWKVLKWDDHPAFRGGLQKFQETKGVDFFGLYIGAPWFIEVKDFRGYRIEKKAHMRRAYGRSLPGRPPDQRPGRAGRDLSGAGPAPRRSPRAAQGSANRPRGRAPLPRGGNRPPARSFAPPTAAELHPQAQALVLRARRPYLAALDSVVLYYLQTVCRVRQTVLACEYALASQRAREKPCKFL
jgi:hypothetical protein